jgi:hypothetical protein
MAANLAALDLNQLQTALATAIAAEDYALAAVIRDRFADLVGDGAPGEGGPRRVMDWAAMGVEDWLADRAARVGFRFPTGESLGVAVTCVGPSQNGGQQPWFHHHCQQWQRLYSPTAPAVRRSANQASARCRRRKPPPHNPHLSSLTPLSPPPLHPHPQRSSGARPPSCCRGLTP